MRTLSPGEFRWLAKMCGGAALLLFTAIFINDSGLERLARVTQTIASISGPQTAALYDTQGLSLASPQSYCSGYTCVFSPYASKHTIGILSVHAEGSSSGQSSTETLTPINSQLTYGSGPLVGTPVSVVEGTPVVLEWTCLPFQMYSSATDNPSAMDQIFSNSGGGAVNTYSHFGVFAKLLDASGNVLYTSYHPSKPPTSGIFTVTPTQNTSYRLNCSSHGLVNDTYITIATEGNGPYTSFPGPNTTGAAQTAAIPVTVVHDVCYNIAGVQTTAPANMSSIIGINGSSNCYCNSGYALSGDTCIVSTSPTATIVANPMTIIPYQSTTLTATFSDGSIYPFTMTSITGPNNTVVLSGGLNAAATRSYTWTAPTSVGSYNFYARGTSNYNGTKDFDYVTVTVAPPPPPSIAITANDTPTTIYIPTGTAATLRWSSENVKPGSCYIKDGSNTFSTGVDSNTAGLSTGVLTTTHGYELKCLTLIGDNFPSQAVTVYVVPNPTLSITANYSANNVSIPYNSAATIRWSASNVQQSSCAVTYGLGTAFATGNINDDVGKSTGTLTSNRTYTLNCNKTSGVSATPATVTVTVGNVCPTGATGTYPSCVCPSGQTYNSGTNTCPASSSPTASLSSSAGTTMTVGQSTMLTATFAAASGDTLTTTGIADNANSYLSGGSSGATPRTYTWTPTAAGSYLFYARAATAAYPTADNYNSVTITVAAAACTPTYSCSGQTIINSCGGSTVCSTGSVCVAGQSSCAPSSAPTASITANGSTGTVYSPIGVPVTLVAGTFAASTNDTLTKGGVVDYANTYQASRTTFPGSVTYSAWSPAAALSYIWYAGVDTTGYPGPSSVTAGHKPASVIVLGVDAHIYATNMSPSYGGSTSIYWDSTNTASCSASGPNMTTTSGTSRAQGSAVQASGLTTNSTYTLSCNYTGGTITRTVNVAVDCTPVYTCSGDTIYNTSCGGSTVCSPGTVCVNGQATCSPGPVLSITANNSSSASVGYNSAATIRWSASNVQADSCTVTYGSGTAFATGDNNSTGVSTGALTSTRVYTLVCNKLNGNFADPASVTVSVDTEPPPSCSLTPSPTSSWSGQSVALGYTITNTAETASIVCSTAGASGVGCTNPNFVSPSASGSTTVAPTNSSSANASVSYTMTVSNGGGSSTCQGNVVVKPALICPAGVVSSGSNFTITANGGNHPNSDSVYLYTPGAANSSYLAYQNIPTATRPVNLTFNLTPAGNYEARLFSAGTYNQIGSSCYFSVAAPNTITISASGSPTEPSTTGTYLISRTGSFSSALSANFTLSGSATRGSDYSLSGGGISGSTGTTLTFGADVSSLTVTLTPLDDALVEGTETALMTVTAPAGYSGGGSATLNIADNDAVLDVCGNIIEAQSVPPTNGYASGGSCFCNSGYTLSGSSCVQTDICTDIFATQPAVPSGCLTPIPGPSGACTDATHVWDGVSQCTTPAPALPPVSLTLNASPTRVHNGGSTILTWSASGGGISTCTLSSTAAGTLSSALSGTSQQTITQRTAFTLTCNGNSTSVTVTVLPSFLEI